MKYTRWLSCHGKTSQHVALECLPVTLIIADTISMSRANLSTRRFGIKARDINVTGKLLNTSLWDVCP
jgi:hypothetical protein